MTTAIHPTDAPSSASTDVDRRGRDRRVLHHVGRHGAVSIEHVMAALGLRRTTAYDQVAALIEAGLLERLELLRGEPALIRATRSGLRCAGLGMAPAVVSPGSVDHWLRCAAVALDLEARHGAHRILTERELAYAERHEERPIASAKIGELPNGAPRLHRPDLVVLPQSHPLIRFHTQEGGPDPAVPDGNQASAGGEGGGVISVEVELTAKSPKRLREIVRGWRRASWVDEVHYLCEPGQTRRAVERAVEKLHASDRIRIGAAPPREGASR